MKKKLLLFVALLALTSLLAGSAFAASGDVNICGTTYTASATPRYFLVVNGLPVETGASAGNYNMMLVLKNGVPDLTLKNASLKAGAGAPCISAQGSITIRGVGTNSLEATAEYYVCVRTVGDCTFEGQIERIVSNKGKNVYVEGNCSVARGARIGSFEGGATIDLAVYGSRGLTIDGEVGQIGSENVNEAVVTPSFTLNGKIGQIKAKETAVSSLGDVVVNGRIGEVTVLNTDGGGRGIYSSGGRVEINNAVGPVRLSSNPTNSQGAVAGRMGVSLNGVKMILPADGSIGKNGNYACVLNADGQPAAEAQFELLPPATGDGTNPALWAAMQILSAAGVVLLLRRRKNKA